MTRRAVLRAAFLAAATALSTVAVGWAGVPLTAALWGVLSRGSRGAAAAAGLGAMLGWGGLLAIDAARGPVPALATSLGIAMGVSPWLVGLATLLLPAALAWSATVVAGDAARLVARQATGRSPCPPGGGRIHIGSPLDSRTPPS